MPASNSQRNLETYSRWYHVGHVVGGNNRESVFVNTKRLWEAFVNGGIKRETFGARNEEIRREKRTHWGGDGSDYGILV